jgi:chromosome partitioning protein
MYIVSIAGEKGGTGKTTTAMSLAAVASEVSRVLMVDADPQGSATWWAERAGDQLPFDFASGIDPGHLASLRSLADYDVIVVDTPGSLHGRAVIDAVVAGSDVVVLPTQPAALSVVPLIRTVAHVVAPLGIPYRVLLNLVDPRRPAEASDARAMLDARQIPYLQATIRRYAAHERGPLEGLVVTQYPIRDRYSRNALDDYRRVASELFHLGGVPALGPALHEAMSP